MTRLLKALGELADGFVPPALERDPENARRAKGIAVVSITASLWWPLFAYQYHAMHAPPLVYLGILGCTLFLVSSAFIVRWSGALKPATHVMAASMFVTLTLVSAYDGGIHCQAMLDMPVIPIVAICFGGIRSGLFWMCAVVVEVATLYILHRHGVAFPRLVDPASADTLWVNGLLSSLTVLTLSAGYYEHIRNHLYGIARNRARELEEKNSTILAQQQFLVSASKMAALGEMAGGVAHEINTPLAAIRNLSEQISEVAVEEPLNKGLLTEMTADLITASDRIARIVRSLRSFSRDGSGDPRRAVDAKQLIEETLGFCGEQFKSRGIRLIVDCAEDGLCFMGRPAEISQVLLNLLNNAQDAVAGLRDPWVKISARAEGRWIEIRVADSGHGIPPDARQKLFQPFFTTKELGKGTGLGLSVSLGIVQEHSGSLRLDQDAANTCFVIELPGSTSTVSR
jgi:signal transduction histidine kinase